MEWNYYLSKNRKIGVAPGKMTQPVKVLANKSDDQRFVFVTYMVKGDS